LVIAWGRISTTEEGNNMSARWSLVITGLLATLTLSAQERAPLDCGDDWGWLSRRARACEIRNLTVPATGALSVEAGPNGSIRVTGDDRRDVQVRARVQAWGDDEADAESIAKEVIVRADEGTVRAEGPERRGSRGWNVSYELLAPRAIDLVLETTNGGISVADVRGDLTIETVNGGIHLEDLAGNVRGRTTNGGVEASLAGDAWEGEGLDLKTTNGGVRLRVPEDYSARLETVTVNGGIDIDFPVTVQGRVGRREMSTTLGEGGALIRAATTNGGVHVSRR
jgi:hypothetical protein